MHTAAAGNYSQGKRNKNGGEDLLLSDVLHVFDSLLESNEVDLCRDIVQTLRDTPRIGDAEVGVDGGRRRFNKLVESAGVMYSDSAWQRRGSEDVDVLPEHRWQEEGTLDEEVPTGKPESVKTRKNRLLRVWTIREGGYCRGLPWLPAAHEGGLIQRWFSLFTDSTKSILGKVIEQFIVLAVGLSTVALLLESMPECRQRPELCEQLKDRGEALTVEACEPQPTPIFGTLEIVCVAIFTFEYLARILTVHSVSKRPLRDTLAYARQPLNAVDLMAVLPFYAVRLMNASGHTRSIASVFRLGRVLRLFKVTKYLPETKVFADTMVMSGQPLAILLSFNLILVVIFGSLMYSVEGRRFSVAEEFTMAVNTSSAEFPASYGAFVRLDAQGEKDIISPFRSIPYCMWWVCTTMTTIGYGEFSPTTLGGKVIGVVCFYVGVIFLAMPITVLGANFQIVYTRRFADDEEQVTKSSTSLNLSLRSPSSQQGEYMKALRRSHSLRVDKLHGMPWFPSCDDWRQVIFTILEDPMLSKLGKLYSMVMLAAILLSTVSFVLESIPDLQIVSPQCKVELTVDNCMPAPAKTFENIEWVCMILFTIDYILRVSTVHSMGAKSVGLPPDVDATSLQITMKYARSFLNVIDLVAILPFYVELSMQTSGASFGVLRVIRLVRTLRVLKEPKLRLGSMMLVSVVVDCLPALVLLFTMSMLTCILFSAFIVFAEGSQYTVSHFTTDYPYGLYIRPTKEGLGVEPSPFRSIPYAFWWFFTTATTVGYGDDYPTTTFGRFVALCSFYTGIIMLALPITIIGDKFTVYYPEWAKAMGHRIDQEFSARSSGSAVFSSHQSKRNYSNGNSSRLVAAVTVTGAMKKGASALVKPFDTDGGSKDSVERLAAGQAADTVAGGALDRDASFSDEAITIAVIKDGQGKASQAQAEACRRSASPPPGPGVPSEKFDEPGPSESKVAWG